MSNPKRIKLSSIKDESQSLKIPCDEAICKQIEVECKSCKWHLTDNEKKYKSSKDCLFEKSFELFENFSVKLL